MAASTINKCYMELHFYCAFPVHWPLKVLYNTCHIQPFSHDLTRWPTLLPEPHPPRSVLNVCECDKCCQSIYHPFTSVSINQKPRVYFLCFPGFTVPQHLTGLTPPLTFLKTWIKTSLNLTCPAADNLLASNVFFLHILFYNLARTSSSPVIPVTGNEENTNHAGNCQKLWPFFFFLLQAETLELWLVAGMYLSCQLKHQHSDPQQHNEPLWDHHVILRLKSLQDYLTGLMEMVKWNEIK